MRSLQVVRGWEPEAGFALTEPEIVIGRHADCTITLSLPDVSRQHARITQEADGCFLEDLGSRNGTYVNGERISGRQRLNSGDRVEIGSVELLFLDEDFDRPTDNVETHRPEAETHASHLSSHIVAELDGRPNLRLELNPTAKLNALLNIIGHLGSALSLDDVLARILDGVFEIFPQADRGYILLANGPESGHRIGAVRMRHDEAGTTFRFAPISRTVATRVLTEGKAILTSDAMSDERFEMSGSVLEMEIRSMLCAPLVGHAQKPIGLVGIDSHDPDREFTANDLDVLVSIAALAAQAVEYSRVHQALLDELTLRKQLEAEMAEVTVREQQRIGQELHDGLGQELIGLRLIGESLLHKLPENSPEAATLSEIVSGLRRALDQARAIARGLVPDEVKFDGLCDALRDLARRTEERHSIACLFEGPESLCVKDDRTAMGLFRIAQEAVTNACKHARASRISIQLQEQDGLLQLMVADDGIGLPKQLPETAGVGQRIMRFRANMIGAKFQIGPGRQGGTSVVCTLET